MGETLHVAYKKYKIKKKIYFFLVITKYISSRELQAQNLHLMKLFGIHLKKVIIVYLLVYFSLALMNWCCFYASI